MNWLIDGHNLIGHMPNLRLDDPHDEEKLVDYLLRYRAKTGHAITVMFDAGAGHRPGGTQKRGGLTIQYAPSGQTADQLIAHRLRQIKNPQAWRVVSSDKTVQRAAQFAGVRSLPAREFAAQLLGGNATTGADPGDQPDVRLSPDEIEAWLDIFGQN